MTIHVSKDVESSINAAVRSGRFPSVNEAVTAAWTAFEKETPAPDTANGPPSLSEYKPIWEVFAEIASSIPDEEWDKLPEDGAEQHDHYSTAPQSGPQSGEAGFCRHSLLDRFGKSARPMACRRD